MVWNALYHVENLFVTYKLALCFGVARIVYVNANIIFFCESQVSRMFWSALYRIENICVTHKVALRFGGHCMIF